MHINVLSLVYLLSYLNLSAMVDDIIYPSEKSKITLAVFVIAILILLSILVLAFYEAKFLAIIFLLLPLVFLISLWTKTYYKIDDDFLYYRSGPFNGKVAISAIREIVRNKTLWVGFKPALSSKGLIIKYEKWNEIYISPRHKDKFLSELLKRNRHIRISE